MKILIYHSKKALGKSIQFSQSNNWNHVGVEVNGFVYEMLGNGLVKRTIEESIADATQVIYAYVDVDDNKAQEILEMWLKQKVKYFFRGIAKQLVYQLTNMFVGRPLWIGKNYIQGRFICSTLAARLLNLLLGWYAEWWKVTPETFANSFTKEGVEFGIEEYNWHKLK